jgi:tetratricopeptide (TPR) repeat protein
MLFLKVDRVAEAVEAFAAEVGKHPGNLTAARELGLGLARLGEHRRAIAQLELLTRRVPRDGESWRALGFAYMQARRPREAEQALRRALALPPETALEHRDLGYVLAVTGRTAAARAEYRRAIALDPLETGAWVNLGNLERAAGDPERALADYREAAKRDTGLAVAVRGEAQALVDLRRLGDAAAAYRRLLVLQPGDHEARLVAVRLYEGLGRPDVALELARDGVRRDPGSGPARLTLGMALEADGHLREAALELRRAESLAPDSAGRARARGLLTVLRSRAPDSLRALLEADSSRLAGERPQRPAAP